MGKKSLHGTKLYILLNILLKFPIKSYRRPFFSFFFFYLLFSCNRRRGGANCMVCPPGAQNPRYASAPLCPLSLISAPSHFPHPFERTRQLSFPAFPCPAHKCFNLHCIYLLPVLQLTSRISGPGRHGLYSR